MFFSASWLRLISQNLSRWPLGERSVFADLFLIQKKMDSAGLIPLACVDRRWCWRHNAEHTLCVLALELTSVFVYSMLLSCYLSHSQIAESLNQSVCGSVTSLECAVGSGQSKICFWWTKSVIPWVGICVLTVPKHAEFGLISLQFVNCEVLYVQGSLKASLFSLLAVNRNQVSASVVEKFFVCVLAAHF